MYAKTTIVGRLGGAPEFKTLAKGNSMARVTVATDHHYKKDDNWETETEWYRVTFFGWAADAIKQWAQGDVVLIEGRMRTRTYEAEDGTTRYITELLPSKHRFLGNFRKNQNEHLDEKVPKFDSDEEIPF